MFIKKFKRETQWYEELSDSFFEQRAILMQFSSKPHALIHVSIRLI